MVRVIIRVMVPRRVREKWLQLGLELELWLGLGLGLELGLVGVRVRVRVRAGVREGRKTPYSACAILRPIGESRSIRKETKDQRRAGETEEG